MALWVVFCIAILIPAILIPFNRWNSTCSKSLSPPEVFLPLLPFLLMTPPISYSPRMRNPSWHLLSFVTYGHLLTIPFSSCSFPTCSSFHPLLFLSVLSIPCHSKCYLNILNLLMFLIMFLISPITPLWFDRFLVLILPLYDFINLLLFCLLISTIH